VTQANLNKGQIRVVPKSKEFGYVQHNPNDSPDKNLPDQPSGEEIYEEQYDPN